MILLIGAYAMVSEAVNQYATLLGLTHGGIENDSNARYLFATVGIAGETIIMFSLPTIFLVIAYFASRKLTVRRKWTVALFLFLTALLGVSTTYATITDYYTLHAYHLL